MFDPPSWLRFWKPRLRNRSVMVVAVIWLLSVAGSFTGPADAAIITTGDVLPGGAGVQPDPWAVGGNLYVGNSGSGTLNVEAVRMVERNWQKSCRNSGSGILDGARNSPMASFDEFEGSYGDIESLADLVDEMSVGGSTSSVLRSHRKTNRLLT